MKYFFACCILLITLPLNAAAAEIEIRVAANSLIFDSFMKWTNEQPCHEISNFDHPLANRGTVELVLTCQAFQRANLAVDFKVKKYPNYQRALTQAEKGNVHMPAETLWKQSVDPELFYATEAIIRDGEFEKGLYTLANNEHVLRATDLEDLQALTAVMPKSWFIDWDTLQAMGVKTYSAPHKESMFRMVGARHVDFTLLEFSSAEDMSNLYQGVTLVPIPNLKIGLKGTRHLVISKHAPSAEVLYKALDEGLKQLRADGVISKAFYQSGFFNARVRDWKKAF